MNRQLLTRLIFTVYLILLIYKYFNNSLLGQQLSPLFTYPGMNFSYWIFLLSGINNWFFNHPLALCFINFLLFASCLGLIIKPKLNYLAVVFSMSIWIYYFLFIQITSYQSFAIGFLFPCIPFMFKDNNKFELIFEGGRYFLCGLYGIGGFLKIFNGGIAQVDHLSSSIKITVPDFMMQNPNHIKTYIMEFLIQYEYFSFFLYLIVVLLEASFMIGFFTKKYDKFLLLLFFVFHLSNAFIMDIPFLNHLIIATFLLPFALNQSKTYAKFESSLH